MECPNCQSQDVILCSVAHEQGTTTTQTHGTISGGGSYLGSSAGGGVAAGGMSMSQTVNTTSKSQTGFAERCAPPRTPALTKALIVTLIAAWVGIALLAQVMPAPVKNLSSEVSWVVINLVLWLAIVILPALWVRREWRYRPEYHAALERWRRSWACARCGHIFIPKT